MDDLQSAITCLKCVSHNEGNLNSFSYFWRVYSFSGIAKVRVFLLGIVLTTYEKNTSLESGLHGCSWFVTDLISSKAESKKLDSVPITTKQGKLYCISKEKLSVCA